MFIIDIIIIIIIIIIVKYYYDRPARRESLTAEQSNVLVCYRVPYDVFIWMHLINVVQ